MSERVIEVEAARGDLIRLAFRMLGTVADAEDAVQEASVRWLRLAPGERAAIANPAAWLTTATSRICLDALTSARARRERYVGEWLPEPVPGDLLVAEAARPQRGLDRHGVPHEGEVVHREPLDGEVARRAAPDRHRASRRLRRPFSRRVPSGNMTTMFPSRQRRSAVSTAS